MTLRQLPHAARARSLAFPRFLSAPARLGTAEHKGRRSGGTATDIIPHDAASSGAVGVGRQGNAAHAKSQRRGVTQRGTGGSHTKAPIHSKAVELSRSEWSKVGRKWAVWLHFLQKRGRFVSVIQRRIRARINSIGVVGGFPALTATINSLARRPRRVGSELAHSFRLRCREGAVKVFANCD